MRPIALIGITRFIFDCHGGNTLGTMGAGCIKNLHISLVPISGNSAGIYIGTSPYLKAVF